jgi:hypothetical protein
LLCRGFTMKSSAPAFRHLLRASSKKSLVPHHDRLQNRMLLL